MLLEKLKSYNIILASKSPRRQELLNGLGVTFSLSQTIDIAEEFPENLKNEEIPIFLSKLKSSHYINKLSENDILITADTIVSINGKTLNKPANENEAFEMLNLLSGKLHKVFTGVTIASLKKTISFFSKTEVMFKNLTKTEIDFYITNYKPYDKAGAYGIQEWIGYIGISKINGSYFNVMGLPTEQLFTELSNFVD
jgi:septum formation protein